MTWQGAGRAHVVGCDGSAPPSLRLVQPPHQNKRLRSLISGLSLAYTLDSAGYGGTSASRYLDIVAFLPALSTLDSD